MDPRLRAVHFASRSFNLVAKRILFISMKNITTFCLILPLDAFRRINGRITNIYSYDFVCQAWALRPDQAHVLETSNN